jgi:uncharacterized membrane protein
VDILNALFRWMHILAGIVWIGILYFFNWVNGPLQGALDGDMKKKLAPELMPRALFWFRWGAAWTWITGVLLLTVVFYHGGIMFDGDGGWTAGAIAMVAVTFLACFVYDALHKSPLGKDPKTFGALCFVLVAIIVALMVKVGGFSYRAFNIHLGALFGTAMAFNVWFRIWPAQKVILRGVKGDGPAADPSLVAMAGARSRHNTYMSVPLFWAMINQHHVTVPTALGIPASVSYMLLLAVILLGWHIVWQLYKKAGKVKGF